MSIVESVTKYLEQQPSSVVKGLQKLPTELAEPVAVMMAVASALLEANEVAKSKRPVQPSARDLQLVLKHIERTRQPQPEPGTMAHALAKAIAPFRKSATKREATLDDAVAAWARGERVVLEDAVTKSSKRVLKSSGAVPAADKAIRSWLDDGVRKQRADTSLESLADQAYQHNVTTYGHPAGSATATPAGSGRGGTRLNWNVAPSATTVFTESVGRMWDEFVRQMGRAPVLGGSSPDDQQWTKAYEQLKQQLFTGQRAYDPFTT